MKSSFFVCLLFIVSIVSCGHKPGAAVKVDAFAASAEQHLPMVVDLLYPQCQNTAPEVSDKNTLYNDDSLHISSFVMKFQNALGVSTRDTFEYFFGLNKDASYYYLLSSRRHRFDELMSVYTETLKEPRYQNTDSITRKWMLHGMAAYYCNLNNGGKLKE